MTGILFFSVLGGRVRARHSVQVLPQETHVGGREGSYQGRSPAA